MISRFNVKKTHSLIKHILFPTLLISLSANALAFDYENATQGLTKEKSDAQSVKVSQANNNFIVGGYVSDWAQYDRAFDLEKMEPTSFNRLIFSFLAICGKQDISDASVETIKELQEKVDNACAAQGMKEHEIVSLDMWGDFQSRINQRQVNYPWSPAYDKADKASYDLLTPDNTVGLMGQLLYVKGINKNLKVSASIGGWTLSGPYKHLSSTYEGRATFNQSVIKFINKWGLDGVDIDWEYPQNTTEGAHYATLMKDLREALNAKGLNSVELSSAVGATPAYIEKIGEGNYSLAAKYLDNIYVMSYDYWGQFSDYLGHQTNLWGKDDKPGIDKMVDALLNVDGAGGKIPSDKLIIGVANYARGKIGVPHTPGNPDSAGVVNSGNPSFGTYEDGVLESYDLFKHIAGSDLKGDAGFKLFTDPNYNADYYYNDKSNVYFSVDTPRTANLKARYVKEKKLGGVFSWSVEQDYQGMTINAMNEGLGNTLVNSSDSRQKWYNTCGVNLTQAECDDLNQFKEIADPEEPIAPEAPDGVSMDKTEFWMYEAERGMSVNYKLPRDNSEDKSNEDYWLVLLKKDRSIYGKYVKIKAGSALEGTINLPMVRSRAPKGGDFLVGITKSVPVPRLAQFIGEVNTVTIK